MRKENKTRNYDENIKHESCKIHQKIQQTKHKRDVQTAHASNASDDDKPGKLERSVDCRFFLSYFGSPLVGQSWIQCPET
mmetsp:Transcript_39386/g.62958  ORF Transcript_39386/g.62958 Transcript_39386/m.62958 type:complete len:80 (-) Transcript_39386:252-491(-)